MNNISREESKKINQRILKLLLYRRKLTTSELCQTLLIPRDSMASRLSMMKRENIIVQLKDKTWRLTFHGEFAFVQLEQWFARNPKHKKKGKVLHVPILRGYKRWGSKRKGLHGNDICDLSHDASIRPADPQNSKRESSTCSRGGSDKEAGGTAKTIRGDRVQNALEFV